MQYILQCINRHDQNAAPSNMHLYPRGGHGYGRCTVNQAAAKTFYDVCTWPDRGTQFLQKLGAAPKKSVGSMPKEDDDDDGDEEEEEGRVVDAFYAKPLASNAGETGSRSIDSSEIPLWPAGKVPEEHPGAYPAKEAVSCLTVSLIPLCCTSPSQAHTCTTSRGCVIFSFWCMPPPPYLNGVCMATAHTW